jgi:hypothetical protein
MIVEVVDNGVHKVLTRCRWLWQMEPLRERVAEAQENLADVRDEAHKDVTVANATGKETVEVMEAVDPNEKGAVDLNHGVKDKEDPMAQRGEEPPVNQRGEVQERMTWVWNEEEYWEGRMTVPKGVCVDCGFTIPDGYDVKYRGFEYCKRCCDKGVEGMKWM